KRAVNDVHFHVDNRIATQHTVEHCFVDPLFDRRDVFPRNNAAHDLVLDGEALAALGGTDVHFHVPILTAAAGLFDQLANAMGAGGDRFAVRDLRFTGIRVHFELAEHAVTNDF